jgi:uncharacterized protein YciW
MHQKTTLRKSQEHLIQVKRQALVLQQLLQQLPLLLDQSHLALVEELQEQVIQLYQYIAFVPHQLPWAEELQALLLHRVALHPGLEVNMNLILLR